jgi:chloramphenicol O-acetyltransferase type B
MSTHGDSLLVIAFADEACAEPTLLAAWASEFVADDPITLVIHPGATAENQDPVRISAVAEAAGIGDDNGSANVVVLTGPLEPDADARLAARSAALYSRRPASGCFASLARVDDSSVSGLRTLLQGKIYDAANAPVAVTIGRHSYFATPPQLLAYAEGRRIEIGSFCSISGDVRFYLDGSHRTDFITTSPFGGMGLSAPPGTNASKGPITIGHDVWVGHGASVLSGVTIGTGAVVGTQAVVASDVRPYAIVVGNPAREIRRRFADEDCEMLLASRWWEWNDEKILSALGDLWSTDVRSFAERWATGA